MTMADMAHEYFRANVGAVVVNRDGLVLALKRRDARRGGWQMPQGGIERGESPREAIVRELQEETALRPSLYRVASEYPEWLSYELPKQYRSAKTGRGQTQKWFLCRLKGADAAEAVTPDAVEFAMARWVTPRWLLAHVIAFRRDVYRKVFRSFGV